MTLSDFKAGCGGSSNQLPGGSDDIGINVTFMVPAAKHPRHRVNKVTFPLFVALVDKNENVIDRRDESVDIKISDKSLNFAHKIIYTPPKEVAVDSENHRILVGFNESKPPIVSSSEGVKKIAPQKPRKKRIKRVGYLS
ncbi:MAG: hypothetical protein FJX71_00810 [Alphaproteobacteria bacterium]|nr:hypothetical protein [Alphaproteobacteria bacterium]